MSRILLAEDDSDIQHLLSYKLEQNGFQVVAVNDGPAALEAIRRTPPDLAILDVQMPHLSGIEVCRQIRASPQTAHVPVLMLTARARPQDLDLAYAAGATDYIVKPFSPRQLLTRIEAALARVHT